MGRPLSCPCKPKSAEREKAGMPPNSKTTRASSRRSSDSMSGTVMPSAVATAPGLEKSSATCGGKLRLAICFVLAGRADPEVG